MIRTLNAHEINARVNQVFVSEKWRGVSILLYKDARCDMAILDEHFGSSNWKVDYQMVGSQMFCTISFWDEAKQQWITKQSNGTESNMEAEKGQASDAFKRAGFMVGVGRELYTAPDIMITCDKEGEITTKKDNYGKDKHICNCKFDVKEIGYNEHREISHLVITKTYRKQTEVAFTWDSDKPASKPAPKTQPATETPNLTIGTPEQTVPEWKVFYDELSRRCPDKDRLAELCKMNGVKSAKELTKFKYEAIKRAIA